MIPNRIAEIRTRRKLNQQELADRVVDLFGGTCSQQTISKLESGDLGLDLKWMIKLSAALDVPPAELLNNAAMAAMREEVDPLRNNGYGDIADIVSSRDLHLYTVNTDSVSRAGIARGQKIGVVESETEVAAIKSGDIALVRIGIAGHEERYKMLYQYVEPSLLVTNRIGNNLAINIDDPALSIEILGRVIRR